MNFDVEVTVKPSQNFALELYTDGGCHNNGKYKGLGAWAYVFLENGKKVYDGSGALEQATNNRAELLAVLHGLKCVRVFLKEKYPANTGFKVYCDSQYVVNIWNKYMWQWQGSFVGLANQDLLDMLWVIHKEIQTIVEFIWVKGHGDNTWNNIVDQMCTIEIDKIKAIKGPTMPEVPSESH